MAVDRPVDGGSYDKDYRAYVRDNLDPRQLGRVRVYCPGLMGDVDSRDRWLPWAMPKMGIGKADTTDSGTCLVPDVGAAVWVSFENGDPSFPVYEGAWTRGNDSSSSALPLLARGQRDTTLGDSRAAYGVTVGPSAGGESVYPRNRLFKTKQGHVVELDDTPGKERIRIRHAAGTWEEYRADGALWKQVVGDFLLYVGGKLEFGTVGRIVLGGATLLLGSTSANERVVKQSSLTTVFNGHTHTIPVLSVTGTAVAGSVTGTTGSGVSEAPGTTLTNAHFSSKVSVDG